MFSWYLATLVAATPLGCHFGYGVTMGSLFYNGRPIFTWFAARLLSKVTIYVVPDGIMVCDNRGDEMVQVFH